MPTQPKLLPRLLLLLLLLLPTASCAAQGARPCAVTSIAAARGRRGRGWCQFERFQLPGRRRKTRGAENISLITIIIRSSPTGGGAVVVIAILFRFRGGRCADPAPAPCTCCRIRMITGLILLPLLLLLRLRLRLCLIGCEQEAVG